uniref:NADH dehydrogenase subunit 6 n=1 Tax=Egeirotrioza xingi TaxID=3132083 RepID=UPI0030FE1436
MLKNCLMLMLTISIFMMNMTSPISMSSMLLIQTIISCVVARMLTYSSWLPMTMFLVMVSGLMIIFMYITSITSNNKFKLINWKFYILIFILIMLYTPKLINKPLDNLYLKDVFNNEFMKLYLPVNIFFSIFMFIYLIIALIIFINLMNKSSGPLRMKY